MSRYGAWAAYGESGSTSKNMGLTPKYRGELYNSGDTKISQIGQEMAELQARKVKGETQYWKPTNKHVRLHTFFSSRLIL